MLTNQQLSTIHLTCIKSPMLMETSKISPEKRRLKASNGWVGNSATLSLGLFKNLQVQSFLKRDLGRKQLKHTDRISHLKLFCALSTESSKTVDVYVSDVINRCSSLTLERDFFTIKTTKNDMLFSPAWHNSYTIRISQTLLGHFYLLRDWVSQTEAACLAENVV